MKHVEIDYHFIQDRVAKKHVDVQFIGEKPSGQYLGLTVMSK
jgi:hypothetical protein